MFLRMLDKLTGVLGYLPFSAMLRLMGPALSSSRLPQVRRRELVAEFHKNDPRSVRGLVHEYLVYLGRYGSVAPRLCRAGVPAWVVHTEHGDGGITDGERRVLAACPRVSLITIPGTSYLLPNEEPARIAEIVVEALAAADATRP